MLLLSYQSPNCVHVGCMLDPVSAPSCDSAARSVTKPAKLSIACSVSESVMKAQGIHWRLTSV